MFKVGSKLIAAGMIGLAALAGSARANSIGLDFDPEDAPGNNGMLSTDIAGVVPQANWNSSALRNSSGSGPEIPPAPVGSTLIDNTGANTGATVTWAFGANNGPNVYNAGTYAISGGTPLTGDEKMLNTNLFENPNSVSTVVGGSENVTVSNVPYSTYSAYVYFPGDPGSNGALINVTANGTTYKGLKTDNSADMTTGTAFPYVSIGTNTLDILGSANGGNGREGGNYALFTGLTGSTLNITVAGGTDSPALNGPYGVTLAGIQIVQSSSVVGAVPVPAAAWIGLAGLTALGLGKKFRLLSIC